VSDEILRLAAENDQFARAILDFYAAQQEYKRRVTGSTPERRKRLATSDWGDWGRCTSLLQLPFARGARGGETPAKQVSASFYY